MTSKEEDQEMYSKDKCFNEHCPHLDKEFNDNCGNYTFGVLEKMCRKYVSEATESPAPSGQAGLAGYVDKLLNGLHKRIQKAGEEGRGCRITAEEAEHLKYYNLPNTTEHISTRDE